MPRLISAIVLVFLATAASAQSGMAPTANDASQASAEPVPEIDEEALRELITTLESETARERFLGNLRTLLETGAEEEKKPVKDAIDVPLDDVLPVATGAWTEQFNAFLEKYDLEETTVIDAAGTAVLVLVGLSVAFIIAHLLKLLQRRTQPVQQRLHLSAARINWYFNLLRGAVFLFVALAVTLTALELWEVKWTRWISEQTLQGAVEKIFSVLLIVLLGAVLLESANGFSEHLLKQNTGRRSARLDTLLPIVRSVVTITLLVLFGLVMLSELGLDVGPLLAGAGILGVAVGFGAQTVVKDFLTGFIVILEDLIQVGDVACVGGKTGFVEKMTVRKVQLRALDGRVYTVPFSEIGIVENLTKEFSFYLMEIGVAYREDTDAVVACLREIDEEMRHEEPYRDLILQPLEVLGVDKFADSAVVIKARIKTLPVKQWQVGREFNRRMKKAFDRNGIQIPFPHRTLYFGVEKDGSAPPAFVQLDTPQPAANDNDAKPA